MTLNTDVLRHDLTSNCLIWLQLLGNFLSWHGILSTAVLQNLALDGLLNRYIIFSLHNSFINKEALSKCQTVSSLSLTAQSQPFVFQSCAQNIFCFKWRIKLNMLKVVWVRNSSDVYLHGRHLLMVINLSLSYFQPLLHNWCKPTQNVNSYLWYLFLIGICKKKKLIHIVK